MRIQHNITAMNLVLPPTQMVEKQRRMLYTVRSRKTFERNRKRQDMSRLGNTAGPPRHLPPASAWSPGLAFISLLWANATAFVLIGRSPLGGVFRFGFHDIVAGYDVYAGDILFTMLILLPFGALSLGGRRLARAHTALAAVLPLGVLACFAAALASAGGMRNLSPAFAEGGFVSAALAQTNDGADGRRVHRPRALPAFGEAPPDGGAKDAPEEIGGPDFTGKRVLLAEDNKINREIAAIILSEAGFALETAVNGKEAADMVGTSAPGYYDAVLMDIWMPVMNGYEAARAIRALGRGDTKTLPIIALSANAREEDKRMSMESGIDHHITKPFDVAQLIATVSEHTAARGGCGDA